jgi:hypothetical protein
MAVTGGKGEDGARRVSGTFAESAHCSPLVLAPQAPAWERTCPESSSFPAGTRCRSRASKTIAFQSWSFGTRGACDAPMWQWSCRDKRVPQWSCGTRGNDPHQAFDNCLRVCCGIMLVQFVNIWPAGSLSCAGFAPAPPPPGCRHGSASAPCRTVESHGTHPTQDFAPGGTRWNAISHRHSPFPGSSTSTGTTSISPFSWRFLAIGYSTLRM